MFCHTENKNVFKHIKEYFIAISFLSKCIYCFIVYMFLCEFMYIMYVQVSMEDRQH